MLEPAPNFEINFKKVNHFNKRSAVLQGNPVLMAKSDLEMGLLFKFPVFFAFRELYFPLICANSV
jgi:hypothetical protein